MRRSMVAGALAALALGVTGAPPAAAAADKPAGCPSGDWQGPLSTLEVAVWLDATYGDGTQTVDEINAWLQDRADLDDDGFVCLKVKPEDRLPEPAQVHSFDLVLVVDARSSARG